MDAPVTYKEIRDIVVGKLVDKTIDDDYEDLSERLFGEGNCYSASEVRKRMYGMKAVIDIIDREGFAEAASGDKSAELDERLITLQKERQKFFDQRASFTKVVRERSRQEELNEILVAALSSGNLPSLDYEPSDVEPSDNDLLVSLNDIHYGATHSNFYGEYNSDVCRQMMAGYLDKIIHIGEQHHSENCIVWQNGDAISGSIHRSIQVTNKENVIEQLTGVSELIAQFIAELSKHFNKVLFVSVAGNHSRIEPNKENALLEERLDDLIEWYLKARLQNFGNVVIGAGEKLDPTMYVIDIRGLTYCGVHGDFEGSDAKVQALQTMARRPLYAVLSGHKHHNRIDNVQGIKTVMAGSFLGVDDYCIQKRIYGKPEQLVCVCDSDGIRCYYDIAL